MGTNFYLHNQALCPTCGRGYEAKHIGKSSGGWVFALHVIPEEGINDLADWVALFDEPGTVIKDEYGDEFSAEDMLKLITGRTFIHREWNKVPFGYKSWAQFHATNHSEPGPYGLLRSRLDEYCIKHGSGTWDCIVGDFS